MVKAAARSAVSVKYDMYYQESLDALGPPTPRLVEFLTQILAAESDVLDVGCGQGRDAIWLARAGHCVTGIDPSTVGIAQLQKIAADQKMTITACVADLVSFVPPQRFDCVLFDRTLHMLSSEEQIAGFSRLLKAVKPAGCVVVLDEAYNLAGLQAAIPSGWEKIWGGKSDFAYRRPK